MQDMLTIEEAAEMLRSTKGTLRRWRYERSGPPSAKIGNRVMYRRSDLIAWLDEQFAREAV